nr:MAG TPA: hypothetical protein [Caudoviricetes sp.]
MDKLSINPELVVVNIFIPISDYLAFCTIHI